MALSTAKARGQRGQVPCVGGTALVQNLRPNSEGIEIKCKLNSP